ncbi:MAG TPA: DUF58 domain-containing protein [Cyclobacteriaceae bacterium]|nr:DUF58 domain-containing protein [Cyclobacteriaceae bacterium]
MARQLVEGFITGLHKSPYHGFSVEFAEHRLYNEGESTRHIDWKVYARTDRLYTKRYEEETNLRCLVAIDRSPSMFYPAETRDKILFSVVGAASLGYLLQKQRDAVGLCLFSNQIETLTSIKSSPTHLNKLLTLLEQAAKFEKSEASVKTNVSQVLHEVAEKIHRRSLVLIFSDMFDSNEDTDELFKSLQHLKHNKHEVILFHVMDRKTELEFEFEDKPIEFIDLETKDRIKLNPQDIRDRYKSSLSDFHQRIKMRCNQYKIDYIEADVRQGYDQILQTYLIKRARMR